MTTTTTPAAIADAVRTRFQARRDDAIARYRAAILTAVESGQPDHDAIYSAATEAGVTADQIAADLGTLAARKQAAADLERCQRELQPALAQAATAEAKAVAALRDFDLDAALQRKPFEDDLALARQALGQARTDLADVQSWARRVLDSTADTSAIRRIEELHHEQQAADIRVGELLDILNQRTEAEAVAESAERELKRLARARDNGDIRHQRTEQTGQLLAARRILDRAPAAERDLPEARAKAQEIRDQLARIHADRFDWRSARLSVSTPSPLAKESSTNGHHRQHATPNLLEFDNADA